MEGTTKVRPLILIAEDDANLGRVMSHLLEKAGYRTKAVSDALDAVNLAREEPPELVLMDVVMPGIPGTTAGALLRETPGLAATRVVLVTGMDAQWLGRHLEVSGAVGVLRKPFSRDDLLRAVETGLSAARQQEVSSWSHR